MTTRMRFTTGCATIALLLLPTLATAQTSGGAMSGNHAMAIDCSNSHAMMAHLMNPDNGPFTAMSSGFGVDQNYGSAQMQIAKLQANLAKIELACGKNAQARAAAQKALDDANATESEINAMLHTN